MTDQDAMNRTNPTDPAEPPRAAADSKPPRSGLASASFLATWLAALLLLVDLFAGTDILFLLASALFILGFLLGIAGWVSIHRSGSRLRGRGEASVAILVPLLLLSAFILAMPIRTGTGDLGAEHTILSLKNSISSYYTEFRQWPGKSEGPGDLDLETDERLMNVLLGATSERGPSGRNPRGIVFYTDRQARPHGEGFARGLSLNSDGGGTLWDPWGRPYRVRLDADGDGRVEDPSQPGRFVPESVLVWSAGRDGKFETWKDNLKTWED